MPAAVADYADVYPKIPWKAFALGAAVAAMFTMLNGSLRPDWASAGTPVFDAVAILVAGAVFGLLAMFVRPFEFRRIPGRRGRSGGDGNSGSW